MITVMMMVVMVMMTVRRREKGRRKRSSIVDVVVVDVANVAHQIVHLEPIEGALEGMMRAASERGGRDWQSIVAVLDQTQRRILLERDPRE